MKNVMIAVLTVCLASAGVASAATWKLVDDFSGTSVDTSIWDVTEVASTSSVTIVSGRLHLYSPWKTSTPPGAGAFVTLKDTFSIDDSEDTGVFSLAFDVEMGASMTRSYGHDAAVYTVSGGAERARAGFYGGGDKDIFINNGSASGHAWLEKNFQNQPLHIQVTMSTSNISFKVFNFKSGNAPVDYTDTSADLNDLTAGSLIGAPSLGASGIANNSEELYLFLAGTYASTSGGCGDIYFDNVYTSVPEPATAGLLVVGGLLALVRRRRR